MLCLWRLKQRKIKSSVYGVGIVQTLAAGRRRRFHLNEVKRTWKELLRFVGCGLVLGQPNCPSTTPNYYVSKDVALSINRPVGCWCQPSVFFFFYFIYLFIFFLFFIFYSRASLRSERHPLRLKRIREYSVPYNTRIFLSFHTFLTKILLHYK
jgi:hypothetical protein